MTKKPAKQLNAFKNVIVTGTVAGNDGRKMSKSLGNYTDPNELMDKFSADSLRFLLLSSPLLSGEDFSLQDKDVGDVARKLTMVWNMYDFFTMYAEVDGWEFEPVKNTAKSDITIRQLSTDDDEKELEYLRRVPEDENGFVNPADKEDLVDIKAFKKWLKETNDKSNGIGLAENRVPQTIFYVEKGDEIVGVVKIRHYLNDRLRNVGGGHIGYGGIPEKYRGQGIATEALRLAIEKLHKLGEDDVLLTAHESNVASCKVIEKNGGVLEKVIDDIDYPGEREKFYWIKKSAKNSILPEPQNLTNPLDIWIASRLHQTAQHIEKHLDDYNIPEACAEILPFLDDASNWYVRRSRRRFWKSEDDGDKNDAYRTLHYVLAYFAQIVAPFCPFMAEELWQKMVGGESVHLRDWPKIGAIDEKVLADMKTTREIIEKGLALRMNRDDEFGQIKVRQPLARLAYASDKLDDFYEQIIADEVNVKLIEHVVDLGARLKEYDVVEGNVTPENWVELEKKITPELRREGQAREIIRVVQNARKQAGLNIDDRIVVNLTTSDRGLNDAIDEWRETIAAEILATEFAPNDGYQTAAKVDNIELTIQLEKEGK